mmetsp:Transcript_7513/g.14694  ORF Transcript_7513/g.14694 Transcript_7513/m.14694 type:complete len:700 (+) Transcript_7513:510-2609(+)
MMMRTSSPVKRKHQVADDSLARVAAGRTPAEGWVSGNFSPRGDSSRCEEMTPPPESRMLRHPPTPPMAPPRSPWKKARRGGGSPNSTFEEDYFDEERMWTSGEQFRFDHAHGASRSGTPNSLSAEGVGRLSIGTLDLSGNSENSVLYASADREYDASGPQSPKGCSHDSLSMSSGNMSATNISQASTRYPSSSSPTRIPPNFSDYPDHRLGMSQGSPDRITGHISVDASSIANVSFSAPLFAPAIRSPLRAHDSPLHPQRLFNPPLHSAMPPALPSTARVGNTPFAGDPRGALPAGGVPEGGAGGVAAAATRPFAMPPPRPFRDGQVQTRRNPFLGVDAVSFSPHDVTRHWSSRAARLTVRSFLYDFFDFKEIGKGSSGRVYKCYRKIDLCPYAVKEISTAVRSPKQRERLLREIYAHSSQVDNIHVVRYYNAWEQDDVLFIQTELCAGTLAKVREEEGPLGQERLATILVQLAAGLAYMHATNLAHMDVKPENMFWTERGVYKLGDFGLVTPADAAEHLMDEGDKRYLSREMLQGNLQDLTKSDVFALGVSMYELASDRQLPTGGEEYQAMREGRFAPLPAAISPAMCELLAAMMHPDATQRPSAADIVRHPMLLPYLRDETFACLRAEPSSTKAVAAADGEMVRTHLRALEAEKKVARLEAALKESERKLCLYKECVQSAMRGTDANIPRLCHAATM